MGQEGGEDLRSGVHYVQHGWAVSWPSGFAPGAQVVALSPCPASLCSPVPRPGMDEMPSSVSLSTVFLAFWSRVLPVSAVVSTGLSGSEQGSGAGVVSGRLSVAFDSLKLLFASPSVTQGEAP